MPNNGAMNTATLFSRAVEAGNKDDAIAYYMEAMRMAAITPDEGQPDGWNSLCIFMSNTLKSQFGMKAPFPLYSQWQPGDIPPSGGGGRGPSQLRLAMSVPLGDRVRSGLGMKTQLDELIGHLRAGIESADTLSAKFPNLEVRFNHIRARIAEYVSEAGPEACTVEERDSGIAEKLRNMMWEMLYNDMLGDLADVTDSQLKWIVNRAFYITLAQLRSPNPSWGITPSWYHIPQNALDSLPPNGNYGPPDSTGGGKGRAKDVM